MMQILWILASCEIMVPRFVNVPSRDSHEKNDTRITIGPSFLCVTAHCHHLSFLWEMPDLSSKQLKTRPYQANGKSRNWHRPLWKFTKLSWVGHYWYMVMLVCTFSDLFEAFPTWTGKAWEMTKVLFRDVIPIFRLPLTWGSGGGVHTDIKDSMKTTKGLLTPKLRNDGALN